MDRAIFDNIDKHERIAHEYNKRHPEIYNPIEQKRLRNSLTFVRSLCESSSPVALDYGCGTGNVTAHLLDLGFTVEAADVTPRFVDMVVEAFHGTGKVRGRLLNGTDLVEVASETFDVVTVYSVLHHIPDYLHAIREMTRVLKPGGILFLDHEFAPEYWTPSDHLLRLREITNVTVPLSSYFKRLMSPAWYVKRYRKTLNPRYQEEGDIHVWPDDHIEWEAILDAAGPSMHLVRVSDYLYYQSQYPIDVFNDYSSRCSDLREVILRKTA